MQGEIACFDTGPRLLVFGSMLGTLRLLSRERSLAVTRGLGYLGLGSCSPLFLQREMAWFVSGPRVFWVLPRFLRLLRRKSSLALTRGLGYLGLCSVLTAFEQGELACFDTGPRLFGSMLGTFGF